MDICVIGTGYVGLVTGVSLAYLGNNVVCVDIDEAKIERLKQGISPIYEPGVDELIDAGIRSNNLSFTTDLAEALSSSEIIYIAVGTPPLTDGSPDLSYVKSAAQGIGRGIMSKRCDNSYRIIINKSTVPVGCGNWVEMIVREEIRALAALNTFNDSLPTGEPARSVKQTVEDVSSTFSVISNPEFLKEGSAIRDTFYPDRIVVGANDQRAIRKLQQLYRPILEQSFEPPQSITPRPQGLAKVPLVTTDLTSSEMIKYAANSFLAMKISFANEMANICEQTGADISQVVAGIGLDSRIGPQFLSAGVGWGGSCFGKDVSALIEIAREYGYKPELLESVKVINKRQRQVVIQKLQAALRIIKGRTIGLLGLAFKPNTDDVRDAPSFDIASSLVRMGALVKAYDPVAIESFSAEHEGLDITYSLNAYDLAVDCDALVVVTEWNEFRHLDLNSLLEVMRGSILIDGRNIFDPAKATEVGFHYQGIGREPAFSNKRRAQDLTFAL